MKMTMTSGTGKQVVVDVILEEFETGRPLEECPPGCYSAKIVTIVHHELSSKDKTIKALRSYQRQAISEFLHEFKTKETKPAKGPRNRWGGMTCY